MSGAKAPCLPDSIRVSVIVARREASVCDFLLSITVSMC